MFTFSHSSDGTFHREQRELKYFQGPNPEAAQFYQNYRMNNLAAGNNALVNYIMYNPNATIENLQGRVGDQSRNRVQHLSQSPWFRHGAAMPFGNTIPAGGPMLSFPMSPGLLMQRTQQQMRQQNYTSYQSPRQRQDLLPRGGAYLDANVSTLSPHGPGMTVPLDMPARVPRMRRDGTMTTGREFTLNRPSGTFVNTGPDTTGADGRRDTTNRGVRSPGRSTEEWTKKREEAGKKSGERNRKEQSADKINRSAELKTIAERDAKLTNDLAARQKTMEELDRQIKTLEEQAKKYANESAESEAKATKAQTEADALGANLEQQAKKIQNDIDQIQKTIAASVPGLSEESRKQIAAGNFTEEVLKEIGAAGLAADIQKQIVNQVVALTGLVKISQQQRQTELNPLIKSIAALRASVKTTRAGADSVATQITKLRVDRDAARADIATLQSRMKELRAQREQLQKKLASNT